MTMTAYEAAPKVMAVPEVVLPYASVEVVLVLWPKTAGRAPAITARVPITRM